MPFPRSNHDGAIAAGRLYVAGDYGGTTSVQSAAFQGDGSLSAWRTESSTNLVRQRAGMAAIGSYIYVVSGLPFTNVVERAAIGVNGVLGPWQSAANTLRQRYQVGVGAVGPFLFAMGGYNDADGGLASVETATASGGALGSWQYTLALTQPHSDADATVAGNHLYVVGPYGSAAVEYSTVTGCGNGILEGCEECDDGNVEDGDCCSSVCLKENTPACSADEDNDGVLDTDEPCVCLNTLPGSVVTTVGCGVEQVCPCSAPLGRSAWRKRGEYVRCVKDVTRELLKAGRITLGERRTTLQAARASGCGN